MKTSPGVPGLSLLPFLSVLMCAIGSLVVIFSAMSLLNLESPDKSFALVSGEVKGRLPGQKFLLEPIYIVCERRGVTIHFDDGESQFYDARDLGSNRGEQISIEIASRVFQLRRERWPVFAVRPGGIEWYYVLRSRFEGLAKGRDVAWNIGKWAFGESDELRHVVVDR